jgi:TP901 family phage tail tape measure protein
MPTISTLTVLVNADTRRFAHAMTFVGTAVVAAGIAVTKMALDYDNAFTKIAAVSNASAADVAKWKGEVLDLAGKTAQAPKELADALYFLASAGLKTSQIMPVLAASAKASAVGLGETSDIAKITANTLNAYSGSGLKAAQVTDTLVAAVREGSADTDEFSTALGRILPIASAAHVSFGSVAASLSSLSNIGLDVNEGVTAMRGLLQALVSPTSAAALALKGVGLSSQVLLKSLQGQGLIATIRMLDTAVKDNTGSQSEYMSVLRTVVPNVRSLTGFLGLTTQQADAVDAVFKRVTDSTGSLNTAFSETSKSAGFKFRQALSELTVVAVKLGELLLPILATAVTFLMENTVPALQAVADWFKKLWDKIGPVVTVVAGPFLNALKSLWAALQPTIEALKKLWDTFGPILKIVAAVGIAFVLLQVLIIGAVLMILAKVVEFAAKTINVLATVADWLKDKFVGAWRAIAGPVLAVIGGITNAILALIHAVQTAIEWISKLGSNIPAPLTASGAPAIAPHGLPPGAKGQEGGDVLRTGLALIHKGETLVPAGGGGLTVIINGDVTGEEVVRKVRDGLLKLKARNSTTGL